MRHRTYTFLASLTLLAAVASCDRAPTSAARSSADGVAISEDGTANSTAIGNVRFTFGATTAHLSFIVSNNGSSVTTGKALYYSSNAGVVMVINVTCLSVSGGTATFLGTILESNDAGIEGFDAYWQVQDGSTDYASLVNLAEGGQGPSCTTPGEFDLVAVSAGSIVVS